MMHMQGSVLYETSNTHVKIKLCDSSFDSYFDSYGKWSELNLPQSGINFTDVPTMRIWTVYTVPLAFATPAATSCQNCCVHTDL